MKEIFLDTNIIIDYLTNREPFAKSAFKLFALAESGELKMNVSAISYTTVYYVLKKNNTHQAIIDNLALLSSLCNVLPINKSVLEKAMKSDFADFEDAVQYYSALQNEKCKIIITRNSKDFKISQKLVMNSEEFLSVYFPQY